MPPYVQPASRCGVFVNDFHPRHEPCDLHVVVTVFGEEELSRQFHLGCVEGEVTEETTFLLNQESSGTAYRETYRTLYVHNPLLGQTFKKSFKLKYLIYFNCIILLFQFACRPDPGFKLDALMILGRRSLHFNVSKPVSIDHLP